MNLRHNYGLHLRRSSIEEIFTRYVWREHRGTVKTVTDLGRLAASGGEDGSVILWNLQDGKSDLGLTRHPGCVRALAGNGEGTLLVSGGEDGLVRCMNIADRTVLSGTGHYKDVYALAFSPNERFLASGGADGTLRIWDTATWQCRQTLRASGPKAPSMAEIMSRAILSIAIDAQSQLIFTGGQGNVRIWDLENSRPNATHVQDQMQYIRRLFVLPGTERLIIGGDRTERSLSSYVTTDVCRVIQISDGTCLFEREGIKPMAISKDGRLFAGIEQGDVRIYWTDNLSVLCMMSDPGAEISSAAFSRDTRFLIVGKKDGTVQAAELIWNYDSSSSAHTK